MKTGRAILLAAAFASAFAAAALAAEEEQKEFKFAYVDMEKVMDQYVLFAEAKKEAETKIKEAQVTDKAKLEEYQTSINDLEAKLGGPLTPDAKAQAEDEYKAKVQEALDFRDALLSKYKGMERDAFEAVYKKVYEKIQSYAEKNDYDVVFDYSATLLYADDINDNTDDVVKELNDEAGVGE